MNDKKELSNDKKDPWLDRKQAADYTEFSAKSFPTWDSRKTYDLQPELRDGVIKYRQSVLDAFLEKILIKKARSLQA